MIGSLLADFDEVVKYSPYLGNKHVTKFFKTYNECLEYINADDVLRSKQYQPEIGWNMKNGDYDTNWNNLMRVVNQIGNIKMPDDVYEDGQRVYVERIYPIVFGKKDEDGYYIFRFNGFTMQKRNNLIEAVYTGVVEVLRHLKDINNYYDTKKN